MVEVAFRVHGPPIIGLGDTMEDGTQKRLHKGGRGLAFWYSKVRCSRSDGAENTH